MFKRRIAIPVGSGGAAALTPQTGSTSSSSTSSTSSSSTSSSSTSSTSSSSTSSIQAPRVPRGLERLPLAVFQHMTGFLPPRDLAVLNSVNLHTRRVVVPPLPPIKCVEFRLSDCYARVGAERNLLLSKPWIETEEQSMMALQMEDGGAKHFLQGGNILEYVLRNWNDHKDHTILIVVPNLRQMVIGNNPRWQAALENENYPCSKPKAVAQEVRGTLGFQMLKNMSEYRVGCYENDQVFKIEVRQFIQIIYAEANNLRRRQLCSYSRELSFGTVRVPIRIWFNHADFFSVQYQKSVLDMLDYKGIFTGESDDDDL